MLVLVKCQHCGDVVLSLKDTQVRTCLETKATTFLFTCPVCGMQGAQAIPREFGDLFIVLGVPHICWYLAEVMGVFSYGDPTTTTSDLDVKSRIAEA